MQAAISTGPITHLDHLAPLCELLELPLFVVDPDQYEVGKKFYPMIDLRYVPLAELTLEAIAREFTTIFTCGKFWAMELKPLLKRMCKKEVRFVFCPHGMSDKEELLDKSVEQDIHLVYGPLMREKIFGIETGNLRLQFYQKHQRHFDALASRFFQSDKPALLYAPTWSSTATDTSFFTETGRVVEALGQEYNLLIKLHPLLEENDPVSYHRILGKYDSKALFIEQFPPVYPLLEKVVAYVGDTSSIGYDFLYYDRPLFFLGEGGRLTDCGEPFRGVIGKQDHLSEERKRLYARAFGKEVQSTGGRTNTSLRAWRLETMGLASKE